MTQLEERGKGIYVEYFLGQKVNDKRTQLFVGLNEENIYIAETSEKHIFNKRKGNFPGLGATGAAENEK